MAGNLITLYVIQKKRREQATFIVKVNGVFLVESLSLSGTPILFLFSFLFSYGTSYSSFFFFLLLLLLLRAIEFFLLYPCCRRIEVSFVKKSSSMV